ncbi:proline-rich protein 36-like [Onychostoma macrolepis]|uniref:proline-rich protein 36-like n=1 Tax=Onychostoma macrolepis TaxID=369639 RepID=UPI00272D1A97|nr:proline-rich protein 36-like [Onychostoma macrolepis]
MEGSPAHTPTTEGELLLVSGRYEEELKDIFQMDLIDWWGEVQTCTPESPVSPLVPSSPEAPVSPLVPPSPESQPPSPASSQASQFLTSSSTDTCQSLSSPSVSACHALCSAASGLPVSSSAQTCGSPVSTPSLRALDYTSAPSSLVSTVAHHPTGSTGLPRPSGSALVSRRPSAASGLHSSGFA